jgi:hypothetical protein
VTRHGRGAVRLIGSMTQTKGELMKKLLVALVALVPLMIPTVSQALAGDHVEGRGLHPTGRFAFLADGTGGADRANGFWKHTFTNVDPNVTIKGNVTCALIGGKTATIGGRITDIKPGFRFGAFEEGEGFSVIVEDEAKPGDSMDDYFFGDVVEPPPECLVFATFENNIINGDIIVVPGTST